MSSPRAIDISAEDFLSCTQAMTALVSQDHRIAFTNPSWDKNFGYGLEQMIGFGLHSLLEHDQIEVWDNVVEAIHKTQAALTVELVFRNQKGQAIPVRGEVWPVLRNQRAVAYCLSVCDTRTFAQLSRPSVTRTQKDELTGLLNRQGFVTKSLDTLAMFATDEEQSVKPWMLASSIKNYPSIRSAGADIAAMVLKEIAESLRASVRGHDVVGRIEGDLFAALLMLPSTYSPTMVIARLRAAVRTRKNAMKLPDEVDINICINPTKMDANWNDIQSIIDPSTPRTWISTGPSLIKPRVIAPIVARDTKPPAKAEPAAQEQDNDSAFI